MGCIHIYIYKYHTNINDDSLLIKQPQRRMNIALKNIIKTKLQNILCAHFIYPISYGEWVPHLLLFLIKDGSEEFVWTMENVIRPLKRVIFPCHLLTKS